MTLQGCGGYCSSLDGNAKDLCLKCVEKVDGSKMLSDEYKEKLKKKCEEGSEQVAKVESKIKEKSAAALQVKEKSAAALKVHERANFLGVGPLEDLASKMAGNFTDEKKTPVHDMQWYIS